MCKKQNIKITTSVHRGVHMLYFFFVTNMRPSRNFSSESYSDEWSALFFSDGTIPNVLNLNTDF